MRWRSVSRLSDLLAAERSSKRCKATLGAIPAAIVASPSFVGWSTEFSRIIKNSFSSSQPKLCRITLFSSFASTEATWLSLLLPVFLQSKLVPLSRSWAALSVEEMNFSASHFRTVWSLKEFVTIISRSARRRRDRVNWDTISSDSEAKSSRASLLSSRQILEDK